MESNDKEFKLPDVVIRDLLQFLDLLDLAQCRGINQQWKLLATFELKKKMNAVQVDPNECNEIPLLLELFKKSELVWSSLHLKSFDLKSLECAKFLKFIGPRIKKATLEYKNNGISTRQFVNLLRFKVPILEELEIEKIPQKIRLSNLFPLSKLPILELRKLSLSTEQDFPAVTKHSLKFLESLFRSAPKLECLSMANTKPSMWETDVTAEVDILTSFAKHGNINNLIELNIDSNIDEDIMDVLNKQYRASQLKVLKLGCLDEHLEAAELNEFLNAQNNSLEVLHLRMGPFPLFTLPRMQNLRELSIRVTYYNGWHTGRCQFTWGDQFPNLVTLNIVDPDTFFSYRKLFTNKFASSCHHVKNLTLPTELTKEDMDELGLLFPNVLKLTVPAQGEVAIFDKLWTNWPKLKTLILSTCYRDYDDSFYDEEEEDENEDEPENADLHDKTAKKERQMKPGFRAAEIRKREGGRSFDSFLTGIPDASLKIIETVRKQGKELAEEKIEAMQTHSSISNLKELNHLWFYDGWNSRSSRQRSKITGLTLNCALKKMKGLISVLFYPQGAVQFTARDVEEFCSSLNLKQNLLGGGGVDAKYHWFDYFVKYDWQMKEYHGGNINDLMDKHADY